MIISVLRKFKHLLARNTICQALEKMFKPMLKAITFGCL